MLPFLLSFLLFQEDNKHQQQSIYLYFLILMLLPFLLGYLNFQEDVEYLQHLIQNSIFFEIKGFLYYRE